MFKMIHLSKKAAISFILPLLVSGCVSVDQTYLEAKKAADLPKDATTSRLQTLTPEITLKKLQLLNYALIDIYNDRLNNASYYNDLGNASVILTAGVIAHGVSASIADHVLANRFLAGLAISEAIRFSKPQETTNALRIAAKESMCFIRETTALDDEDSLKNRALLIDAMHTSRQNLQTRLVRDSVNIVTLVDALGSRDKSTVGATLTITNKLKVLRATDGLEADLASCLGS
jgi:hypothetical protein